MTFDPSSLVESRRVDAVHVRHAYQSPEERWKEDDQDGPYVHRSKAFSLAHEEEIGHG